jgi:hypothetical protein
MAPSRVIQLCVELAQYSGHRTIWRDPSGQLVHAEPDDELEPNGFELVATLMHPSVDEFYDALAASRVDPPSIPAERWAAAQPVSAATAALTSS